MWEEGDTVATAAVARPVDAADAATTAVSRPVDETSDAVAEELCSVALTSGEREDSEGAVVLEFVCELLSEPRLEQATTAAVKLAAVTAAEGEAAWLEAFWFASQQRKHADVRLSLAGRSGVRVAQIGGEAAPDFAAKWTKQIVSSLRKIEVEDLGDMDAPRLRDSIPAVDTGGRGREDLAAIQRDLNVKVVFCENRHVLLVGTKAKLQKKCIVIRNLLSHYHWRLSGRDVTFETMTAK